MSFQGKFGSHGSCRARPGKLNPLIKQHCRALRSSHLASKSRRHARSRDCPLCRAVAESTQQAAVLPSQVSALKTWLFSSRNAKQELIKLDVSAGLYSSVEDFRLTETVQPGEVGDSCVSDGLVWDADHHSLNRMQCNLLQLLEPSSCYASTTSLPEQSPDQNINSLPKRWQRSPEAKSLPSYNLLRSGHLGASCRLGYNCDRCSC